MINIIFIYSHLDILKKKFDFFGAIVVFFIVMRVSVVTVIQLTM